MLKFLLDLKKYGFLQYYQRIVRVCVYDVCVCGGGGVQVVARVGEHVGAAILLLSILTDMAPALESTGALHCYLHCC